MNAFDDTMNRFFARQTGRAIPIRTSSGLSPDPAGAIGIATLKIVTEEHIQAIAFGRLDSEPQVVVRLDPLGRDASDLLPFANFLNSTVDRALASREPLRIWIPHSITLEALDVMGHRYWRNENAPDEVRRMGETCRVIAHEAAIPGQQLVADVTARLQDHCVTGMAPIEEGHLHAILAWLDPAVADPLLEARERIRLPASGILPNTPDYPIDDRIDRLRKEAKNSTGRRGDILREEIGETLRHWVLREWSLLTEGRNAFQSLGLPAAGLTALCKESTDRVAYELGNGFYPARAPHRLVKELAVHEASQGKAESAALEHDLELRDQAVRIGGVVRGAVSEVRQPERNRHPCHLIIESDQNVIRLRLDDKIKVIGGLTGIVRSIDVSASGGTRISIEVSTGVKNTRLLTIGAHVELMRDAYGFVNFAALKEARERQPWLYYHDAAPRLEAGISSGQSALSIADNVRRRS